METLIFIETALGTVISLGCLARIIVSLIQSALNPEDKKTHTLAIKNVVIALIITIIVTSGAITATIRTYVG